MRFEQWISAEDIIKNLTEPLEKRDETEEPVYTLRDRSVVGKLDLKHRIIEIAVDIQDCEFLDEVDLRYCEFNQVVDFSKCLFRKRFDSGNKGETHTIYRKDLICRGAKFEGPFDLHGGLIEGSAFFAGAKFLNEERSMDFGWTAVGDTLVFDGTLFNAAADYSNVKCAGTGRFENVVFKGEVDLSVASFGRRLFCRGAIFNKRANFDALDCKDSAFFDSATFEGKADFTRASFGGDLYCRKAIFNQRAIFNTLRCGNSAFFNTATFEGDAYFVNASFGRSLFCREAIFKENANEANEANFITLECEDSAFFELATFEGEVDFTRASFGGDLYYQGAIFKQRAIFNTLNCGNSAFFSPTTFEGERKPEGKPATFEGKANFVNASFGRSLYCRGVIFKENAIFNTLKCGDSAFFNPTTFEGEVKRTTFEGEANFVNASFGRTLYCQDAKFERYVNLGQSNIGVLFLGETLPFGEDSQVDLRECQFDRFGGSPKVAKGMAEKQKPEEFSRDPYLQLEKYYRGVGNELEAKRMHYEGRSELRKNAWSRGERAAKWPLPTKLADASLWLLTGYGVHTWLLLIPIFLFLFIGTLVFWAPKALVTPPATPGESNEGQANAIYLTSLSGQEQSQVGLGQHLFDRASYSLDLFLPLVNMHIDENWQPNGLGRQVYAVVHSMVGWILVPLLLASLAGIIRRE